jgi:hypothetical protein
VIPVAPEADHGRFEPVGVDRSIDTIGFECVDAKGKNVTNEVIVNAINLTKMETGSESLVFMFLQTLVSRFPSPDLLVSVLIRLDVLQTR